MYCWDSGNSPTSSLRSWYGRRTRVWILRATIDSDIIDNIVRPAWIGKKGDAFIINRENVLQTTPRFGGKVMEPPKAPDFAAATGTTVEELDFGGETFLYATSIVKLKKWVLVDPGSPYRGTDTAAAGQISGGVNRRWGACCSSSSGPTSPPGR